MQTIRCIEHDGHRKFITSFVGDQLLICDAVGFEIFSNFEMSSPSQQFLQNRWDGCEISSPCRRGPCELDSK